MEMPDFHRRLLDASLAVCHQHGLVLVGGYAMRAHGLVDRPSQDLDFVTFSNTPLQQTTDDLAAAYRAAGFEVEVVRGTPLLARLMVTDPASQEPCAVDVIKKPLQRPPTLVEVYPIANLDDMVGMKVAALHGRSVPRDVVDLAAIADSYSFADLERLGALFDDDFHRETLRHQLDAAIAFDDAAYGIYGLDSGAIRQLRRFLLSWSDDLSMRLAEESLFDSDQ